MIELFNMCLEVILKHGTRSRMLVTWYEQNPDKLFLPKELEHLRGRDLSRKDMWQIVNLRCDDLGELESNAYATLAFKELKDLGYVPQGIPPGDRRLSNVLLPWKTVEDYLLSRVRLGLERCRNVTPNNAYIGALSKMLFLFDAQDMACVPNSLKYKTLKRRFNRDGCEEDNEPTVFMKHGISMPVQGKVQTAYIGTHDPRRWLTTTALSQGDKLSDVLINKWARRLDIGQLAHYDFRDTKRKADQSAMPMPTELSDLSAGITSMSKAEDEYGLATDVVTVHDAGISITSMESIASATESRPIARTSEQILILYPSWYGVCVHQHHETPCRAYGASCLPCGENLVVKGHLPTNHEIRQRANSLHRSIVDQLEKLIIAHNRGIPDSPDGLVAQLLNLVEFGLDPELMASSLIARFHEIKHLVKDVCFANKLEEAFVARGFADRLDDPQVAAGALMKYHSASRHGAPGTERALDAHGGRSELDAIRSRIATRYPQFDATSVGLEDQRSLDTTEDEGLDVSQFDDGGFDPDGDE